MLNLPSLSESGVSSTQLFPHSDEFNSGGGKIRAGQGTVIVALDGSGDTDDICEALLMLAASGGVIYIKEGEYTPKSEVHVKTDNILIQGAGRATKISTSTFAGITIDGGSDYVTIKDLRLYAPGTHGISIQGGDNISIQDVWISGSATTTCIYAESTNPGMRIQNCVFGSGTGIHTEDVLEKAFIIGNYFSGLSGNAIDGPFKRCVIKGNISTHAFLIHASSSDENQIEGNVFSGANPAITIDDVGATKNSVIGNIYVGGTLVDSGTGTIAEHNQT
jgi:hypothetical protein